MIVGFLKDYYLLILFMSPFIGVAIYGILLNINKVLKKLRCTETITGTITSIRKEKRHVGGNNGPRRTIVIYKPTCTYMYDGVTYEREIDDSIGITDEEIGDKYEFKINPNRPKEAMNYYTRDTIGMLVQIPFLCFIILVICSSINNAYNGYVDETKMASSTNETKKYLDGNQSSENANKDIAKDDDKDIKKDIAKDDATEKSYPDNMQKYTVNKVDLWLDKEYVVNQDKEDTIVAKSPDKKVMFYVIVKTHNDDVKTVREQLKNNILKNNPNSKWMSMRVYGNNEFELFSEQTNKYYVKYVVSANTSRKILIKYVYTDENDEGFDRLLETITY